MEVAVVTNASTDEVELVALHRYGDEEAFAEIFRRFHVMVYNVAARLSGDPAEAEDLVQEVFLRVHRHLGSFAGRSSLKTWIYRITINHCRSRLGRRSRQREREMATPPEGVRDPGRGPEERAMAADAARQLQDALAALPRRFREAVVLRDVEGLAYEEIASVLRVPVGTVRSRIARGRDGLRRLLEEAP